MAVALHRCPGGCSATVASHKFACRRCWYRLPQQLRDPIRASYRSDPHAHMIAMTDAMDWYLEHPLNGTGGN